MVNCWRGLNRSPTVAGSGSFLVAPLVYSRSLAGVRDESGVNRGITDTPIHPDPSRFNPIHHEYSTRRRSWRYRLESH